MRVLHVIPSIASVYGGPSQVVIEMCQSLANQTVDRQIEISLITTNADGEGYLKVPTGTWVEYQAVNTFFFKRSMGEAIKYAHGFRRWLNNHISLFDIVHIHGVFSYVCIVAASACKKTGIPYIIHPLGTLDPWSMSQKSFRKALFMKSGMRKLLYSASAIQYTAQLELSHTEKALTLAHGSPWSNGVVIPEGINSDLYNQQPTSENFTAKMSKPYLLYLGRLASKKNIDKILHGFEIVKSKSGFEDLGLVIAGSGDREYSQWIKQLVSDHPFQSQIKLKGWVSGKEKLSLIANAMLFVLPSSNENYGVVVAECAAAGVPVLISDQVYLYPDIEAFKAGWVWDSKTCFGQALFRALDSDQLTERGKNGQAMVAQKFDWSRVSSALTDLYRQCLGRNKC